MTTMGYCEHCGSGPTCAICGRDDRPITDPSRFEKLSRAVGVVLGRCECEEFSCPICSVLADAIDDCRPALAGV